MALRSASFLLLVLVAVALQESCFGSSHHSLKYFFSGIWDPSQGQPHFVAVGYLDDQVFVHYDSNSRRMKPQVSWMEKVGKDDPQYWDRNTKSARKHEETFRENLQILRRRYSYNQSEHLHTLQRMYGCDLQGDGSKGGFNQHGYEGRTFIVFDPETLTWGAPDHQSQITQRKWDDLPGWNQRRKVYLEKTCIEWLKKYLSYKMERTETPKVTMSSRTEVEDGMEMHVCRVDGFYPREIDASWTRDGEVWLQDTLHGSVAPNADETYHYWLSIQIDPKERDRYRCHVEHDGLQEPLDVALKGERPQEPTNSNSNLWFIIIGIVAVVIVVIYFCRGRIRQAFLCEPTSLQASDRGSNSSDQALRLTSNTESNSSNQGRNILLGSAPSGETDTGNMETAWKDGLMVDRIRWLERLKRKGVITETL